VVFIAPPRKRKEERPTEPQISKRQMKRLWAQQKREREQKEKLEAENQGTVPQTSSSTDAPATNAAPDTPAIPVEDATSIKQPQ
jgi:hypothetical protein